ncbi:hypothetical protein GWI33_016885 [Rhynchophorus ferrugineus]|uniref:Uncharacterized protein n=1 Tax=Rhynchophorus ferrugineus TaxID=354439 RepID=A0A834I0Y7_RHYFE|nr:hypothetical protein GWI33_016885 [Rhynchophorus ferrugineus]
MSRGYYQNTDSPFLFRCFFRPEKSGLAGVNNTKSRFRFVVSLLHAGGQFSFLAEAAFFILEVVPNWAGDSTEPCQLFYAVSTKDEAAVAEAALGGAGRRLSPRDTAKP